MQGPQQPGRSLRVLPTRDRVAQALRERVREQGVALALGMIDLRSLEDRLIRAVGFEPIATTQARLLLTSVAPEAARGTSLHELAAQPGFAESFLELWDTLRRAGIDDRGFRSLAARLARRPDNLTGRRFTALARIASAYSERLRARGAVDGVGARVLLPAAVASLGRLRLAALVDGADRLEVESSDELPVIRARLWEALAQTGLVVSVEVPVLPDQLEIDSPELSTSLELLRRNLVEEAPSVELRQRVLLPKDRATRPVAAAGLIPFVGLEQGRLLVSSGLRARLELLEAEDERAALRGVCAAIRERLADGVAPHRITIAVPRLGLARQRVLAALDAAELPREETRGQPVVRAAPLRLAFALLDAAERDLPREALAQLLESAYVGRRDAHALLCALRKAGSRDDRGIGHLARLRNFAAKLARGPHPDLERRERQAKAYQGLAMRWEPLFVKLRLRQEATLRGHLDAVFAALRALRIPQRCLELPELGGGSRERRLERDAVAALARDRAALEALELAGHSLDDAASALGLGREPVTLTDFRAHLEAALAGVRERPAGVRGAGIAVRDLYDLARSPSDHVFVIHAVEGELPGPGRGLPFLDDEDRSALDRAAGRSVLASPSAADAGVFALVCAGIRERMTLVSHQRDAGGREVMRSRYAIALSRALAPVTTLGAGQGPGAAATPAEEPGLLAAGVVPSFDQCSTRGQLLTRVGMLLARGEAPRFLAEHEALARALTWASLRAADLARADVELEPGARALAHARLDFDWAGTRTEAPGLVWQGSATSLEDYAACPYRFFAKRVLKLRPRPSSRDELDAAEQGSVRHLVLAEVMQALLYEGLTPLEGGDRAGHEARVAHEVCEQVLDTWQARERTGPLPLWYLHRDLVARDLSRLLEGERRAAIEAWEPGEFEVGFGVRSESGSGEIDGSPLEISDLEGKRRFEVVGRVDRIDYRGDGREREGLVVDYKSGRVGDRLRYLELGRTQLQLPLYVAWLSARRPDLNDCDAAYISLRDGERSKVSLLDMCLSSVELDGLMSLEPGERHALRARAAAELPAEAGARAGPPSAATGALDLPEFGQRNLADNLWSLLGGVAAGRFDVRPHDPGGACRYCPYGPVCRVERGDELESGEG